MFRHLLCDNVEIKRINSFDEYGNAINEIIETIRGKLEFELKKVTNKNGSEVVSSGELRCIDVLTEHDQINVDGVYRNIINIVPQTDFMGEFLYYVVYF